MGNVSRSFYNDLSKARKSQARDQKSVVVRTLTKSGQVSKMANDARFFATLADAERHIEMMRRNNPKLTLNFQVTDTSNE